MKTQMLGRAIELAIDSGADQVAGELSARGLPIERAKAIADTAARFADDATSSLQQRLVPPEQWPGMVVCRKHALPSGNLWLVIKRVNQGWTLDAALFD